MKKSKQKIKSLVRHVLGRGTRLTERDHGRHWLPSIAAKNGTGLELGVAAGHYSNSILTNSHLDHLYSVDAWADHHDVKEYFECMKLLNGHGTRSTVLRMFFDKALPLFPDGYFDFIYIDAYAGTGQENGKLLHDWWPKLKAGGLYSGHDYHEKWQPTIEAVDKFCVEVNRVPHIVPGVETWHSHDLYDSWYVVK